MLLSNRWVFQEINEDSIDAIDEKNIGLLSLWESNGGSCTMKSLSRESPETRHDILEYLDECPLIDGVCINDKNYVLVHSGLGNYSQEKRMRDYTMDELLWERPTFETKYNSDEYIVIFGHTPTICYGDKYKNRMIKTESWWNIDTGSATEDGRPMLLCLDTGTVYYIEDNDTVIEERN